MIEPEWIMDSECCSKCGALLDYFETDICSFCDEEEHNAEMAREEDWWTEEDEDDWHDMATLSELPDAPLGVLER